MLQTWSMERATCEHTPERSRQRSAMGASGWEVYTSRGKTKADRLADCLCAAALQNLQDIRIREDWTDGDADKEADFYILKHTKCAAVLTENLFMDNYRDYSILMSEEGIRKIVQLHVEGIINYIQGK